MGRVCGVYHTENTACRLDRPAAFVGVIHRLMHRCGKPLKFERKLSTWHRSHLDPLIKVLLRALIRLFIKMWRTSQNKMSDLPYLLASRCQTPLL
jgi:hypothetical protein